MSAMDRYVIKDGEDYILVSENDGWTFLNRGAERTERVLDMSNPKDVEILERYYVQAS